jgi:LuxR family maltose regulon positive regulatory protein
MDQASPSPTGDEDAPLARGGVIRRRGLFNQLDTAPRVTQVSAPAGSGKTVLVRSWITESGIGNRVAWVAVDGREQDPRHFWLSVVAALRGTTQGASTVQALTAAPDLDGWAIVERLLRDLAPLSDRIWMVIDDVHDLKSVEVTQQLQLLIMRAPRQLRFVLVTRHELRMGLHRLRLEGEVADIRAQDLKFSLSEAQEMFNAAGVQLPESALGLLYDRTEGWAAGLRLAALSLSGRQDPERFAAEFSGSDRMVADYLLAEVLERQSEPVRQLLLRTSLLERVNGELAELLTGEAGGERILQDLEQAGAFVVSMEGGRSWFRYHHLFAGLLRRELRQTAPGEITALHRAAADWLARNDYPVEAVRHAQSAGDWELAARMLFDGWLHITLDGQQDTAHLLLTGFAADNIHADAELLTLMAADEINQGAFAEAEKHLAQASGKLGSVAAERQGRLQATLGILRLSLAGYLGDTPTVAEEAQRLLAVAADGNDSGLAISGERRALALISLGMAETWTLRHVEAERHLEQGVRLARQLGWPYLEVLGRAHGARIANGQSVGLGAKRCMEVIEMATRHGWGEQPMVGVAYTQLGGAELNQGHLEEAGRWLDRAQQIFRTELEPAAGMSFHWIRAAFELASGHPHWALDEFRAAERLAGLLRAPHVGVAWMRAHALHTRILAGQAGPVRAALAEFGDQERDSAAVRTVIAHLRLNGNDPQAAILALAPVVAGSVSLDNPTWMMEVLLIEAIARDATGDQAGASRALNGALDLAEPDRMLYPFIFHPAPELMRRYARQSAAHDVVVARVLRLVEHAGQVRSERRAAATQPRILRQPLSQAEIRVLRYLPTGLTVQEIAGELYLSVNTVHTHMRHLYEKLDVHRRHEALERARALGLIAPSPLSTLGAVLRSSTESRSPASRGREN